MRRCWSEVLATRWCFHDVVKNKDWRRGSIVILAVVAAVFATAAAGASPDGQWRMRVGADRFTIVIGHDVGLWASIQDHDGSAPLSAVTWNASTRQLSFRDDRGTSWHWYRGTVASGVFTGRRALTAPGAVPPDEVAYASHVTGWNATLLSPDIVPRTFDLTINGSYHARLHVDRDPVDPGRFIGQFKVYANSDPAIMAYCKQYAPARPDDVRWSINATALYGAQCEEREFDIDVAYWDGQTLRFSRQHGPLQQDYEGTVSGRNIAGIFTQAGVAGTWTGTRADVLGGGLTPPDSGMRAWRHATRARLRQLMMAGDPQPIATTVTVLQSDMAPLPDAAMAGARDDDPAAWPQNYTMRELQFDYALPGPYGGAPIHRISHGYLAVPDTPGPYPVALVVNGHGGSAWATMNPASPYWYGDAFARRGYLTLAIDISHRNAGDDPSHGNVAHPPIAGVGMDSDWEQDGERTWDALRGLDYLLSQPSAMSGWVVVAGLSMGGEVAAQVAALDTRVATAVVAGYSPDLNVMAWNNNHPCWQWNYANIREYVEMPDLLALVAPRQLIVLTGLSDGVFSRHAPPYAADKQVLRRTRMVTAGSGWSPIHYLHAGPHQFNVGDYNVAGQLPVYVQVPTRDAPAYDGDMDWQDDGTTTSIGETLFELIADHDVLFQDGFDIGDQARH